MLLEIGVPKCDLLSQPTVNVFNKFRVNFGVLYAYHAHKIQDQLKCQNSQQCDDLWVNLENNNQHISAMTRSAAFWRVHCITGWEIKLYWLRWSVSHICPRCLIQFFYYGFPRICTFTCDFPRPKQTLQPVQSSFANVNLIKEILRWLWAVTFVMRWWYHFGNNNFGLGTE